MQLRKIRIGRIKLEKRVIRDCCNRLECRISHRSSQVSGCFCLLSHHHLLLQRFFLKPSLPRASARRHSHCLLFTGSWRSGRLLKDFKSFALLNAVTCLTACTIFLKIYRRIFCANFFSKQSYL